jgi:hypothetical protein
MTRKANLAQIERDQNLKAERQANARAEEAHRQAARAETLALAKGRGTEFEQPEQKRGESAKPMKRVPGLIWLHRKERISDDQLAAGVRYAQAYGRAMAEVPLRSILNRDPVSGEGLSVARMINNAVDREQARAKLAMYQRQLGGLVSLITACDWICGVGLTPREACDDGHSAAKMEAHLIVALDLMNAASGVRPPAAPPHDADAA